jgi:hypothetical protein
VCAWPNPQQHTIIYLASQAKPHQLTKTRLSHPTGRKTKMTFLSALNALRILFVIHSLVSFHVPLSFLEQEAQGSRV